jgi:5-oxoprolinase (ATP-hydrolysing) subunit A
LASYNEKSMTIDINCDLGEFPEGSETGNDEAIMPYITSANIACGFHAGNPVTIEKTIQLAIRYGVSIGAHPGYPDPEGFGRRPIVMSYDELRASVLYQVGALKSMAESYGVRLEHVKPHGALYNTAATDYDMAIVIARAVKDIDSSLILVGLSGSEMSNAARETGIAFVPEVFADRAYNDDGSLVSRDIPGAVLHDTNYVIERVVRMINEKMVKTISGRDIPIQTGTICLHGDNEKAPEFAKRMVSEFRNRGILIKSIGRR